MRKTSRVYTRRPLAERFHEKYIPEPNSGCWLWEATVHPDGYGRVGAGGRDGMLWAHRVSWELAHGPIPVGLCVCHRCDNPPCVNPDHLFLGTHRENMRDRDRKGRARNGPSSGEAHHMAKLTEADVRTIRRIYAAGATTQGELGLRFGVDGSTVSGIVRRRAWTHVR